MTTDLNGDIYRVPRQITFARKNADEMFRIPRNVNSL
jgi:hypothetical protein